MGDGNSEMQGGDVLASKVFDCTNPNKPLPEGWSKPPLGMKSAAAEDPVFQRFTRASGGDPMRDGSQTRMELPDRIM